MDPTRNINTGQPNNPAFSNPFMGAQRISANDLTEEERTKYFNQVKALFPGSNPSDSSIVDASIPFPGFNMAPQTETPIIPDPYSRLGAYKPAPLDISMQEQPPFSQDPPEVTPDLKKKVDEYLASMGHALIPPDDPIFSSSKNPKDAAAAARLRLKLEKNKVKNDPQSTEAAKRQKHENRLTPNPKIIAQLPKFTADPSSSKTPHTQTTAKTKKTVFESLPSPLLANKGTQSQNSNLKTPEIQKSVVKKIDDPKTELQNHIASKCKKEKKKLEKITYIIVEEPSLKNQFFSAKVVVGDHSFALGTGTSKKNAEKDAAQEYLNGNIQSISRKNKKKKAIALLVIDDQSKPLKTPEEPKEKVASQYFDIEPPTIPIYKAPKEKKTTPKEKPVIESKEKDKKDSPIKDAAKKSEDLFKSKEEKAAPSESSNPLKAFKKGVKKLAKKASDAYHVVTDPVNYLGMKLIGTREERISQFIVQARTPGLIVHNPGTHVPIFNPSENLDLYHYINQLSKVNSGFAEAQILYDPTITALTIQVLDGSIVVYAKRDNWLEHQELYSQGIKREGLFREYINLVNELEGTKGEIIHSTYEESNSAEDEPLLIPDQDTTSENTKAWVSQKKVVIEEVNHELIFINPAVLEKYNPGAKIIEHNIEIPKDSKLFIDIKAINCVNFQVVYLGGAQVGARLAKTKNACEEIEIKIKNLRAEIKKAEAKKLSFNDIAQ